MWKCGYDAEALNGQVFFYVHKNVETAAHISTYAQGMISIDPIHMLWTVRFTFFSQERLHILDSLDELVDGVVELGAFRALLDDLVIGVHDRRMVASAEAFADLR